VTPEVAEHRFIVLEELPALGTFDITAAAAAATGAAALGSTAAVIVRQPPLFLLHNRHASTVARIPFVSELLVEDPIRAVAVELLAAML
jgi:hypothetical protein